MSSEKVISRGADEDAEARWMWTWFAVKQAGGKVVVTYDDFFTCQGAPPCIGRSIQRRWL
jgi:hypothetical protein